MPKRWMAWPKAGACARAQQLPLINWRRRAGQPPPPRSFPRKVATPPARIEAAQRSLLVRGWNDVPTRTRARLPKRINDEAPGPISLPPRYPAPVEALNCRHLVRRMVQAREGRAE